VSRLLPVKIHECASPDGSLRAGCHCRGRTDEAGATALLATGAYRWHSGPGVPRRRTLVSMKNGIPSSGKRSGYMGEGTTAPDQSTKEIFQSPSCTADDILGPEYDMARGYLPTRSPRQHIEQARPVRARDGHKDFTVDFLLSASVSDGVKYRDVQVKLFCLGCYQAKREPTSTVTLRVPADVDASWKQFWTCRHCCGVGVNPEFKKWYDTHNYIFGMTGRKQQLAYPDNETFTSEDFADELKREAALRNHFEGILQDKFIRSLMTAEGDTDANDTRS
jgi:hypothetical protein